MRKRLCSVLLLAVAALGLNVASATAVSKNTFSTSFGAAASSPANPYPLSEPAAVAVDDSGGPSQGDVYVADPANRRVERFSPAGEFILMFGKEVDKTTGADVCTAASHDECQPGQPSSAPGGFVDPLYLAVDGSPGGEGDLYVGDASASTVQKFDPNGTLVASWGQGGLLDGSSDPDQRPFAGIALERGESGLGLNGIAVDPAGNLFVVASRMYFEFSPDGSFVRDVPAGGSSQGAVTGAVALGSETEVPNTNPRGLAVDGADSLYSLGWLGGGGPPQTIQRVSLRGRRFLGDLARGREDEFSGLAIDPATREVFATQPSGAVEHFAAFCDTRREPCVAAERFGSGQLSDPQGVAVDSSTGAVYVADTGDHRIAVFVPSPFLPSESAAAASHATTTASLAGEVDPAGAGPVTACRFEYVRIGNEVQTLTLTAAEGSGSLTRASRQVTGLATAAGHFAAGEAIEGAGIPPETTVVSAGAGELTLSRAATTDAEAVSLSARPAGGAFTLTFEGHTTEPIPADAIPGRIASGLEALPLASTAGAFTVTGPPGGPFRIEFTGMFFSANVPQLSADPSGLSPAGSAAAVITTLQGNPNWSSAASLPCQPDPAAAPPGSNFTAPTSVGAEAVGLSPGTAYLYRLVAEDANGVSSSFEQEFTTLPKAPEISDEALGLVLTDEADVNARIDPGGGEEAFPTSYRVDYVTAEEFGQSGFADQQSTASVDAGSGRAPQPVSAQLSGLQPGTAYRYRLVASNAGGTAQGPVRSFTTLPYLASPPESCANAHVRQQTGAGLLADCRAYELVSAAHAGGYDVASSLIPGQQFFAGYPQAEGRVLYGVQGGGIPSTGAPTGRGLDPYVAVRGPQGWATEYVGIPADGTPDLSPFSSTLLGADPGLEAFAFGGPEICSPCFGAGIETGIPLRLPDGRLVQGMAGPVEPEAGATADGYIAQPFSADGSHFVFASTATFETAAANNHGNVSIYDRNLQTGTTRVVSKSPGGAKLPCLQGTGNCNSAAGDANGISELGISTDGSRILIAQKVSEPAGGTVLWNLLMNSNDATRTVELSPGASEGVLFAGMSADGSKVFFTSKQRLLGEDTDNSADLYEAELNAQGTAATLRLLSTGPAGPSNSDACDPAASEERAHWNTLGAEANCDVLPIAGGGGVVAGGTVYLLSPELLAGPSHGIENQPNLYIASSGSRPRFVATLSPNDSLVRDALDEPGVRRTADFQATPSGAVAVFPSALPLTEAETGGYAQIYRYDASSEGLDCVSCTLTGSASEANAELAPYGASLTDDGRVLFTTADRLVATDTDNRKDVYEWSEEGIGTCGPASPAYSKANAACLSLISAGTSSSDSGLLSATANGKNVYFFTRDRLVPQDENGSTVKIYDAREEGGFPYLLPSAGCKASDECHGPPSPEPARIEAGSEAGTPHNFAEEGPAKPASCKKRHVRKHGRCVKQSHHKRHRRHHKRAVPRHGALR